MSVVVSSPDHDLYLKLGKITAAPNAHKFSNSLIKLVVKETKQEVKIRTAVLEPVPLGSTVKATQDTIAARNQTRQRKHGRKQQQQQQPQPQRIARKRKRVPAKQQKGGQIQSSSNRSRSNLPFGLEVVDAGDGAGSQEEVEEVPPVPARTRPPDTQADTQADTQQSDFAKASKKFRGVHKQLLEASNALFASAKPRCARSSRSKSGIEPQHLATRATKIKSPLRPLSSPAAAANGLFPRQAWTARPREKLSSDDSSNEDEGQVLEHRGSGGRDGVFFYDHSSCSGSDNDEEGVGQRLNDYSYAGIGINIITGDHGTAASDGAGSADGHALPATHLGTVLAPFSPHAGVVHFVNPFALSPIQQQQYRSNLPVAPLKMCTIEQSSAGKKLYTCREAECTFKHERRDAFIQHSKSVHDKEGNNTAEAAVMATVWDADPSEPLFPSLDSTGVDTVLISLPAARPASPSRTASISTRTMNPARAKASKSKKGNAYTTVTFAASGEKTTATISRGYAVVPPVLSALGQPAAASHFPSQKKKEKQKENPTPKQMQIQMQKQKQKQKKADADAIRVPPASGIGQPGSTAFAQQARQAWLDHVTSHVDGTGTL